MLRQGEGAVQGTAGTLHSLSALGVLPRDRLRLQVGASLEAPSSPAVLGYGRRPEQLLSVGSWELLLKCPLKLAGGM